MRELEQAYREKDILFKLEGVAELLKNDERENQAKI